MMTQLYHNDGGLKQLSYHYLLLQFQIYQVIIELKSLLTWMMNVKDSLGPHKFINLICQGPDKLN